MIKQVKTLVKGTPFGRVFWKFLDFRRLHQSFALTTDGFYFKGNKDMISGAYEPFLRELIVGNKENFSTLVNIGANTGYFPCLALANDFQNVIAVEPDEINFKILELNMKINGFTQVTLVNAACSSYNGTASLYGRNTGASLLKGWEGNTLSDGEQVKTITLDQLIIFQNPSEKMLIIIDVEGFEFEVLKGSLETLRGTESTHWVVEVSLWRSINENKVLTPFLSDLFSLFQSEDYRIYIWEEEDWRILSGSEIEEICQGAVFWPALPFLFKK
jgi:FkbM family methyltransferase